MYRRPKFLEILLEIRREMALEADYDVDLFAEIARAGTRVPPGPQEPFDRDAKDLPKSIESAAIGLGSSGKA